MEVIVFESEAYQRMIDEIVDRLQKGSTGSKQPMKDAADDWIDDDAVMALLGIKNKSYFSTLRSKQQLPCYRPGRHYKYKRSEIVSFIEKHKAHRK